MLYHAKADQSQSSISAELFSPVTHLLCFTVLTLLSNKQMLPQSHLMGNPLQGKCDWGRTDLVVKEGGERGYSMAFHEHLTWCKSGC